MLARMLLQTGNQVGARRQVEEVLAQNPSNVDALKMQASWRLQADEVDEAIADLRVALDTAPEDIQAMNLMYEAYTRTGETDLARDYLALAVEASGSAPDPSLRYARALRTRAAGPGQIEAVVLQSTLERCGVFILHEHNV